MKQNWSIRLYVIINKLQGRWWLLDQVVIFCAHALIYVLAILVLLISFLTWYPADMATIRLYLFFLISSFALGLLFSWGTGLLWPNKRPVMDVPGARQFFKPLTTWKTFPSDHTLAAFILAESLLFFGGSFWYSIILLLLASIIGVSRIFAGVHYPRDIVGGILYATLACTLVFLGI